jgi:hypothetical protein
MNTPNVSQSSNCSPIVPFAQRGLLYTHARPYSIYSGAFVHSAHILVNSYTMLIRCYQSSANESVREQLWTLIYSKNGWISDRVVSLRFYIPEHLLSFALLIDSTLVHIPSEDYID